METLNHQAFDPTNVGSARQVLLAISRGDDIAQTKLQVLHWCANHELVHAGQIALLRRLFGQKPIW